MLACEPAKLQTEASFLQTATKQLILAQRHNEALLGLKVMRDTEADSLERQTVVLPFRSSRIKDQFP